ncbi:MAG: bifunctional UDP-N-acetylglucosamine diphosphorylase/glucosamine-1-phosphate N-acetyltransferase GlmU [Pseudomonadota bacterium]
MADSLNLAPTAAVILAAGKGTRMRSKTPKVLHEVGGLSMLGHTMAASETLSPARVCVVIGDHAPEVGDAARAFREDCAVAVQAPPQGTADAVMKAVPALDGFSGVVLVLYADTPLITPETLGALAEACAGGAAVAVLGFEAAEPGAYGRLMTDASGGLDAIIEAKDASREQLAVTLCNSGVMAIRAEALRDLLPKIGNDNAKGEYYLTDIVGLARDAGLKRALVVGKEEEVLGVNSRVELAEAEAVFQGRMRRQAMLGGATLIAPETVFFSHDTKLGRDVVVGPNVVFAPGVAVADGVEVKAFSHLEGAAVSDNAAVGPYARLRPGAVIGAGAKVGNFVEIKKAEIGAGAKVSHLTYIGDASIGANANIGAGTITCNYDGYDKFRTVIGENAFVGSNSSLVAPVTVGANAYVGSGSVVTKDVAPGALAVARGRQKEIEGWAEKFVAGKKTS